MIKRFIVFLLGIIFGLGLFIGNQLNIRYKINKEIKSINEKIMNDYENKIELIRDYEINNIKEDILKSISLKKIYYKIEITDYFFTFENFYKKALENKEFYEKTLKKDFLSSKEMEIINSIRNNLLKSVVYNGYNSESFFGIPESINCEELMLKSPCIKIKTKFDDIDFVDKKILFDNRDFTQQDILDILSGKKSFYK